MPFFRAHSSPSESTPRAPPERTSVISKPDSLMAVSSSTGSVNSREPARMVRTGAYCQARNRLPERVFSTVACQVGRNVETRADSQRLWKGRRVYLFGGSTVSMPDTADPTREPGIFLEQPPAGIIASV